MHSHLPLACLCCLAAEALADTFKLNFNADHDVFPQPDIILLHAPAELIHMHDSLSCTYSQALVTFAGPAIHRSLVTFY